MINYSQSLCQQHRMHCIVPTCKLPVVKAIMMVYVSHSGVSERLPYLRSLGAGTVILEGFFRHDRSPANLTEINQNLGTLPQFTQLIIESRKAGRCIFIIKKSVFHKCIHCISVYLSFTLL